MKRLHDILEKIALFPLRFYQKEISPRMGPSKCKYVPTCSSYAIEAIREWGIIRGSFLAIWRILRCNPFSKGGLDPVPENKRKRQKQKEKENDCDEKN